MAKARTKKRTHVRAQNASAAAKNSMSKTPRSMVIRVGASQVGSSVSQLVKDVRLMMEPDTAVRLKVSVSWSTLAGFWSRQLMMGHLRNGNPIDSETTRQWRALWVSLILCFSQNQLQEILICDWRLHLAVQPFISKSKAIPFAETLRRH